MDSYRYAAPVPVPVVDDNRNVHCRGGQWPFHIEGRDIEHHVIHTDIGRYLGNGATVMKGVYNGVEGFYYSGHRLLTPAQVRSLKEDSAKWNRERMRSESRGIRGPDYIRSHAYEESVQRQEMEDYPEEPYTYDHPPQPVGRRTNTNTTSTAILAPLNSHTGPNPNYYYTEDGRPFYDVSRQRYIPPFIPRPPPGTMEAELTTEHVPDEASTPRIIANPTRADYDPYPTRGGRGERERERGRGGRDPRRERGERRGGRRDQMDEDLDDEEISVPGELVATRPAEPTVVIQTPEGYIGYWTLDATGAPRFMNTPHLQPGTPII